jgi:hypothetical protein
VHFVALRSFLRSAALTLVFAWDFCRDKRRPIGEDVMTRLGGADDVEGGLH